MSLQQYAACPYRFLLHAIHQFAPAREPVALEQMDPLTRGRCFMPCSAICSWN